MRTASLVFLAYGMLLLLGCLWPKLPLGQAAPDIVALSAMYLGLTARHRLAPPTLGAVVIGYLGDLLIGTPRGMLALVAGIICILGHVIHSRLIVRGWMITMMVSFLTGLVAGIIGIVLRAYAGLLPVGVELDLLFYTALLTALFGPLVFRLCRTIDARFARTYREREAVIEGFTP